MRRRTLAVAAAALLIGFAAAASAPAASGQTGESYSFEISEVSPTPTQAATIGTITANVHVGDNSHDYGAFLVIEANSDGALPMLPMTGVPACVTPSGLPPWISQCEFAGEPGDDFLFTIPIAPGGDAPAGSTYEIRVVLRNLSALGGPWESQRLATLEIALDTMQVAVDTTLTEDHNGHIEITADDVTLDCAGHAVEGVGFGTGIDVTNQTGVTVRNCDVSGFKDGFNASEASGNTLIGNTARDNGRTGFRATFADGLDYENNAATGNGESGFFFADSQTGVFTSNTGSDNGESGFASFDSTATFTDNEAHRNGDYGFDSSIAAGFSGNYCTGNGLGNSMPAGLCQEERVGLVNTASGEWHLRHSPASVVSFYYGNPGDSPFLGDWDCDTVATPGLFRTSDAFAYLRNSATQGNADVRFFFGNPSDIPLAGDFNGDGCDTLSLYRPSEARFYIINKLGENEGGLGAAEYSFLFGNPGDKPVVGDWDGDGIDEIGLRRETTGYFYYRNTLTTGAADGRFFFGDPGDRLVSGDWGVVDGADTPAVFRPANSMFYFRYTLTQGNADDDFVWNGAGPDWLPVSGDFTLD